MDKVLLDSTTVEKLRSLKHRAEICDLEGRIVGYYEPSKFAGVIPPPDPNEDELVASENDPVTYSLGEVWEKIHRGEQL